jgi:hypothetical protein
VKITRPTSRCCSTRIPRSCTRRWCRCPIEVARRESLRLHQLEEPGAAGLLDGAGPIT